MRPARAASFRPPQACTLWHPLSDNHITVNNTTAVPPRNNGRDMSRPYNGMVFTRTRNVTIVVHHQTMAGRS